MIQWFKRNSVIAFFVIAFAISWSIEIPLALYHQGIITGPLPMWLHYFACLGPLSAALIMTFLKDGNFGLRRLVARILQFRFDFRYYGFTIIIPLSLFALACGLDLATTGRWPNLALLGEVDYLPYLTPIGALGMWLVTFGLGEEIGWRGFALPYLQKTHSAVIATLILGLLWSCWHLPMFFYRDTYIQMGIMGFPMLALSLLCAAMIFTWLYNSTHGSIGIVIIFHAVFNWLTANEAGGQFGAIILSAAVILAALYIPRRYGMANAAPILKQVA